MDQPWDDSFEESAPLTSARGVFVPRPLTDADLERMEQRALVRWGESSADLLRLIAEVRGLRAAVLQLHGLDEAGLLEPD